MLSDMLAELRKVEWRRVFTAFGCLTAIIVLAAVCSELDDGPSSDQVSMQEQLDSMEGEIEHLKDEHAALQERFAALEGRLDIMVPIVCGHWDTLVDLAERHHQYQAAARSLLKALNVVERDVACPPDQ